MRERWVGVGASQATDPHDAGREIAQGALSGPSPKLAVTFFSDDYDAAAIRDGIRSVLPDVELVGCSTAGEIAAAGPGTSGAVLTVFGGPGFDVATACGERADEDTRQAGVDAAASLARLVGEREHRAVIVLSDGLAGDQEEVVRGLYEQLGSAVPLVGGCAGDDLKMVRTTQIHNDRILNNAVVTAALASDAPLGVGVRHGWRPVGDPMLVTSSRGNVVLRLDDRPALDVYLERLGADPSVAVDDASIARFALTHPLGVVRRNREEIRFVSGADLEQRSLTCIANVPQGGLTWIMDGDDESVLHATDDACADALAQLDGAAPIGFLAFDCIARREVLGPSVANEVERIATHAGGAPVAGFYTYGEIARTHGSRGFHNQTLVVLAVS